MCRPTSCSKLLKTAETFEVQSREEAEGLVLNFKGNRFPVLKNYRITEQDGKMILEGTKEFDAEIDKLKIDE